MTHANLFLHFATHFSTPFKQTAVRFSGRVSPLQFVTLVLQYIDARKDEPIRWASETEPQWTHSHR